MITHILKFALAIQLVSCGQETASTESGLAVDIEDNTSVRTQIIPDGTYRLSSGTAYSQTFGVWVYSVLGDLIQTTSYDAPKYTIEQSGYAILSIDQTEMRGSTF